MAAARITVLDPDDTLINVLLVPSLTGIYAEKITSRSPRTEKPYPGRDSFPFVKTELKCK
jgi:hypothetical protein